jgi:hypothetical protein
VTPWYSMDCWVSTSHLTTAVGAYDLDPLLLILRYEVIPIAELKRDRDDSSARDARGVAMVLNQWRALSDHVVVLGVCWLCKSPLIGRRKIQRHCSRPTHGFYGAS